MQIGHENIESHTLKYFCIPNLTFFIDSNTLFFKKIPYILEGKKWSDIGLDKIYGSINGQYNDLMRDFSFFGRPSELKGDIECVDSIS